MILKYENSEENSKTSYICLFLFFFVFLVDNSIYSFFFLILFGSIFLITPLNKIPRVATENVYNKISLSPKFLLDLGFNPYLYIKD